LIGNQDVPAPIYGYASGFDHSAPQRSLCVRETVLRGSHIPRPARHDSQNGADCGKPAQLQPLAEYTVKEKGKD
jgi:hypothetical protein